MAQSVVENRYSAFKASHDVSKSHTMSRLALWWIDVHPPGEAFVVTTAPTTPQVEAILWRWECRHQTARTPLLLKRSPAGAERQLLLTWRVTPAKASLVISPHAGCERPIAGLPVVPVALGAAGAPLARIHRSAPASRFRSCRAVRPSGTSVRAARDRRTSARAI
jgi:hypothetical protein